MTFYLDFALVVRYYDILMTLKVKASNTSRIKSVLYKFLVTLQKILTINYIATCATMWFLTTNVFLLIIMGKHPNTKKLSADLSYKCFKLCKHF